MRALGARARPCPPAVGGRRPRRSLRAPRAAPGGREDEGVDIDALASALAAAAAARIAAGEDADSEPAAPAPISGANVAPFDAESAAARAAEVFAEVGDGGFAPESIELLSKLGSMAWSNDENRGKPVFAGSVYAARYTSGAPLQAPAIVLVKEYAPDATGTALACNDLQACVLLAGGRLPPSKWHAANGLGPPGPRAPTYPLLGYFRAAPSAGRGGGVATYLVFKWERDERGGFPLDLYPSEPQPAPWGLDSLLGAWGAARQAAAAAEARACMVRSVAAAAARSLAAIHAAGVAHGSLGAGCVMVSTAKDVEWRAVRVTVSNFMFATLRRGGIRGAPSRPAAADDPVSVAQAADGVALARLLLETALRALGEGGADGGAGAAASSALARRAVVAAAERGLNGDTDGDGDALRGAVAAVPGHARVLECFDVDGGWPFLAALAAGARLGDVAASRFVVKWG